MGNTMNHLATQGLGTSAHKENVKSFSNRFWINVQLSIFLHLHELIQIQSCVSLNLQLVLDLTASQLSTTMTSPGRILTFSKSYTENYETFMCGFLVYKC